MSVKVIFSRKDPEFKSCYTYYMDSFEDSFDDLPHLREDWIHIVIGSNKSEVKRVARDLAGYDFYIKNVKTETPFWMAVTVASLYYESDDY